jgi:hypothetical protein
MPRPYGRVGCLVPGCNGKHRANGYCNKHYYRFHRHGDLGLHYSTGHRPDWKSGCCVSGCLSPRMGSLRMCGFHSYRQSKYGNPLADGVFKDTTGGSAERIVGQVLEGYGRKVEFLPYNSPCDLIVDGIYRVEVKSANVKEAFQCNGKYSYPVWQFNIHRHNVLNEDGVDIYILCLNDANNKAPKAFLLRGAPVRAKTIQVGVSSLLKLKHQHEIRDFYAFARGRFALKREAA